MSQLRNSLGTTILVPLKTNCPIARNSDLTGMYCLYSRLCHSPVIKHSREVFSMSWVVIAAGVDSVATKLTYSSAKFSFVDIFIVSLDSASAIFCHPGMYLNLYRYGCILSTHLSIRALGLDFGECIHASGL